VSNYKFNFLGWNNQGTSDKVWGYITVGEGSTATLYNFWGPRTKSIAFKKHPNNAAHDLRKLAKKKESKGYEEILVLSELGEGWTDHFEKLFVIAKMFDNFHNTDT
jgi:hypothetical protein